MAAKILTQVVIIDEIKAHPQADRLEIAMIRGWSCIVPKGQYQAGQKAVYFQPDTILPKTLTDKWGVTNYCSEKPQGMRIRSAKLRGCVSMGLLMKPEDETWEVGMDVADFYHAEKYEPPILIGQEDMEAEHPLFVKYTDIENMRNYPHILQEGEEVVISEKIHGCLYCQSKIMLANGQEVPIQDIQISDMVLSNSDDGLVPAKVENVIWRDPNPNAKWIELEFDTGRKLVCTDDHEILTKNRGWVPAGELTEADDIASAY